MKTLTKQELLNLIDSQVPDDAKIMLFSPIAMEPIDFDNENVEDLLLSVADTFDDDDPMLDDLEGATHLLSVD
jgi:hypothetical protein